MSNTKNTAKSATKSATAKALVLADSIPAAKRGRPVGSGHVWPALVDAVSEATPGSILMHPEAVAPGTAQYLRNRYNLDITTRSLEGSGGKLVHMYVTVPKPVKAKAARKPRAPKLPVADVTPTAEISPTEG